MTNEIQIDNKQLKRDAHNDRMGTAPIGKLLASMAWPAILSMTINALYNVVDSIFVARISENALNAVSLAFPLQHLLIAFGAGTALGMNTLVSRSLGAKNQELANRAAGTGIFLFFDDLYSVCADRYFWVPRILSGTDRCDGNCGVWCTIYIDLPWLFHWHFYAVLF